jgi:hypothetical protein
MPEPRNPYVFIVGCPRSGTTLLRNLVTRHPQLAITPETHWIPRYYDERLDVTPDGFVEPHLLTRLGNHRRFPKLRLEPAAVADLLAEGEPLSYAEFVSGVFDLYAERQGKPLAGDKTPRYVRSIPTLHALWPHARFVHIIRDGRDVCLSVLDWERANLAAGRFATWSEDPVSTCALWWEWNVQLGRRDGAALEPGLYLEVRYEALVEDPERECRRISDFLELPFADEMVPGPDADHPKPARRAPTPGLRDWRSQLPAEGAERFEAAVGDLLDELRYARACPDPAPGRLADAAAIRSRFDRELAAGAAPTRA